MTTWMMCSTVCRRCGKLSICCLVRKQGHRVRALGVLRQLGTRFARKEGSSCGHELSLGCPLSQSPWQLQGTYVYASCLLVLGMKNDRTMRLIDISQIWFYGSRRKALQEEGRGRVEGDSLPPWNLKGWPTPSHTYFCKHFQAFHLRKAHTLKNLETTTKNKTKTWKQN